MKTTYNPYCGFSFPLSHCMYGGMKSYLAVLGGVNAKLIAPMVKLGYVGYAKWSKLQSYAGKVYVLDP